MVFLCPPITSHLCFSDTAPGFPERGLAPSCSKAPHTQRILRARTLDSYLPWVLDSWLLLRAPVFCWIRAWTPGCLWVKISVGFAARAQEMDSAWDAFAEPKEYLSPNNSAYLEYLLLVCLF